MIYDRLKKERTQATEKPKNYYYFFFFTEIH